MDKEVLELQAARYSFGHLTTSQMQKLIEGLLSQGIYADEFLDVVEPEAATREVVGPAFEKALIALGITVPSYEEAVWNILRRHISQIADGQTDALDGLKALIDEVYWSYDFHSKANQYLGDSHGIERLIGLYWEYDEFTPTGIDPEHHNHERRIIFAIEREVVAEAKKWVKRFAEQL
jgi:hypothetical protein